MFNTQGTYNYPCFAFSLQQLKSTNLQTTIPWWLQKNRSMRHFLHEKWRLRSSTKNMDKEKCDHSHYFFFNVWEPEASVWGREIFDSLVYSSCAHNKWNWARPKKGARSSIWIAHVHGKNSHLLPPNHEQEAGLETEAGLHSRLFDEGHRQPE